MEPCDFGWALSLLKDGDRVARHGWNDKDTWLALQTPDENSKMRRPYIYMDSVDDGPIPWVANQPDLLAEDWYLV
jgi:GH35 family endo-1,4-beta-xylanase